MDNDFEYFIMCRKGNKTYPIIKIINENNIINGTISKNPLKVDYLQNSPLSDSLDIVSKKVIVVMNTINIMGIKYIPVQLKTPENEIINDYICINAEDNKYMVMDKEKSVYEYNNKTDTYWVNKYIINIEELNKININKRLCFNPKGINGYTFYHKTVVDIIEKINPKGLYFRRIEDNDFRI